MTSSPPNQGVDDDGDRRSLLAREGTEPVDASRTPLTRPVCAVGVAAGLLLSVVVWASRTSGTTSREDRDKTAALFLQLSETMSLPGQGPATVVSLSDLADDFPEVDPSHFCDTKASMATEELVIQKFALSDDWERQCEHLEDKPFGTTEYAHRNWCWAWMKHEASHWKYARGEWSWWETQQRLAAKGLAPEPETERIEPLRRSSLCERPTLGGSTPYREEDLAVATKWVSANVAIYVLNLDTESDRLERMKKQLSEMGLLETMIRVSGVSLADPGSLKAAKAEGIVANSFIMNETQFEAYEQGMGGILGTVGCAAAHFRGIRTAAEVAADAAAAAAAEAAAKTAAAAAKAQEIAEAEAAAVAAEVTNSNGNSISNSNSKEAGKDKGSDREAQQKEKEKENKQEEGKEENIEEGDGKGQETRDGKARRMTGQEEQQGQEAGSKPLALILEDDLILETDFSIRLYRLLAEVPCDWEVISLKSSNPFGTCISQHIMRVEPDVNEPAERCRYGVNLGSFGMLYKVDRLEKVSNQLFDKVWSNQPHCLEVDVALASISDKVSYYAVPSIQHPGFFNEGDFGSMRWTLNQQQSSETH